MVMPDSGTPLALEDDCPGMVFAIVESDISVSENVPVACPVDVIGLRNEKAGAWLWLRL